MLTRQTIHLVLWRWVTVERKLNIKLITRSLQLSIYSIIQIIVAWVPLPGFWQHIPSISLFLGAWNIQNIPFLLGASLGAWQLFRNLLLPLPFIGTLPFIGSWQKLPNSVQELQKLLNREGAWELFTSSQPSGVQNRQVESKIIREVLKIN